MVLTKSDFLLYLSSPMHLWASKHERRPPAPLNPFDEHLTKQGYEIEALAKKYLHEKFSTLSTDFIWQATYISDHFQARTDVLVYDKLDGAYDLYEIKSSMSSRDAIHLYDAAYQTLILQEEIPLRHINIVTVNSEYVRDGEIDLEKFFTISNVDRTIKNLLDEVREKRELAWGICTQDEHHGIDGCLDPKSCPCPDLCNPDLPEHSIYDVSGLWINHRKDLRVLGIKSMFDIPDDFPIKPKQRAQIAVTKSGIPLIDRDLIRHELEQITTPIAFLDYETFNPGVPRYDGYRPYGVMTFQYSLHVVESLDAPIKHYEHLVTSQIDPAHEIVQRLEQDIPKTGTVIAWNKSYEMGCNDQMGQMYPGYRDFLRDVNDRMYDLGDPFKDNDMYVLPEFKGSWSIKNVLPVLVPDLSYKALPIGEGASAMNSWWQMVYGDMSEEDRAKTKENLLRYCELDTWAMVKIWQKLIEVSNSDI